MYEQGDFRGMNIEREGDSNSRILLYDLLKSAYSEACDNHSVVDDTPKNVKLRGKWASESYDTRDLPVNTWNRVNQPSC